MSGPKVCIKGDKVVLGKDKYGLIIDINKEKRPYKYLIKTSNGKKSWKRRNAFYACSVNWKTKAKKGQKDYRVYKSYTSQCPERDVLVFQSNSLSKAREKADEFRRRGGKVPTAIVLVNKEGAKLGIKGDVIYGI